MDCAVRSRARAPGAGAAAREVMLLLGVWLLYCEFAALVRADTAVLGLANGVSLATAQPLRRLWRTAPSGAASRLDVLPDQHAIVRSLPRWDATTSDGNNTMLFTERISRVRLLGGWKPGAPTGDCVSIPAGQIQHYAADWPCLFARIDPVVAQNLSLVVVFDNVPWAFVRNTTGAGGVYGNVKAPDEDLRPLFARYAHELVQQLAERYGRQTVVAWQWRAATEPNCPCHWLSTVDDYLWYYDVLASAVKTALGSSAAFGPGNMPRGMRMNMVDTILRRLANHSLTAYPPDVLGISYYGSAGNGYRHIDMQNTFNWMKNYADMMTPPATVQFMEYGTLTNAQHQRSNEPSAFGAAWTAGGLVVALRNQIDELYHWHFLDCVGRCDEGVAQQTLIYGWAWLLGVMELLVGLPAAALSTSMDFSADRNSTSITGIAALDTEHSNQVLYAMVTVFGPTCYRHNSESSMGVENSPPPISVALSLPIAEAEVLRGSVEVDQWSLSSSNNSVYDQLWHDLDERDLLKRKSDPYTYRVKDMATEKGKQFVQANFAKYQSMMLKAMQPSVFSGAVHNNGTHVSFSWEDACPTVRVLRVRRGSTVKTDDVSSDRPRETSQGAISSGQRGPKDVFAHYMMCFQAFSKYNTANCTGMPARDCGPSPDHNTTSYQMEMEIAQANGIDGFAIEYGFSNTADPIYNKTMAYMFEACEEYNRARGASTESAALGGPKPFMLLPMFDFDPANISEVVPHLLRHANSPCQYRFEGRLVMSNWRGGIAYNEQSHSCVTNGVDACAVGSGQWEEEVVLPLAKRGYKRPIYIPYIITLGHPPTHHDLVDILTKWTALDGYMAWGCSFTGEASANASLENMRACRETGKFAFNSVSGPVSSHRHYGEYPVKADIFNRYFPSHGAKGIIQEWMAHINGFEGSQPDWVIISTWNDVGEHHYLGPYNYTQWGNGDDSSVTWHTEFPHAAYLELSRYFIQWYKQPFGSAPPSVPSHDESVFYFYNLQPVNNSCPLDTTGPSNILSTPNYEPEDFVYVTSLLAEPATLTIESGLPFTKPAGQGTGGFTIPAGGPVAATFSLPVGLHSTKVKALSGGQRFVVTRGGKDVAAAIGSEGINTTEMSLAVCNQQTFTGVIHLRGS